MKGSFALHRLRVILLVLVALSLTFAPITSAWAVMGMRASMEAAAGTASRAPDDAMSDCMKAMQASGQGQAPELNCPCCDTPSKAACPDVGACFAKCSVHVIAVLTPTAESRLPITRHNWPADPQKPPDWFSTPPAPPPRA